MSFCREVLKRWYVILLCAVLGAVALYYEKGIAQPPVPESGEMVFIRIMQLDEIPMLGDASYGNEIDVVRIMYTWPNMADFLSRLEERFEMKRMHAEWDTMKTEQKFKWDSDHFILEHVGPGTYEITAKFPQKDPKDGVYVWENGDRLLDSYQEYFQEKVTMVIPNGNLRVLKNYSHADENENVDRGQISKKYGIIGFVLGGMVGLAAVTAWISRKKLG